MKFLRCGLLGILFASVHVFAESVYFPPGCAVLNSPIYSDAMVLANEPSLFGQKSPEEQRINHYRLAIRDGSSVLIIVRAEVSSTIGTTVWISELSGETKKRATSKPLSKEESAQLEKAFAGASLEPEPGHKNIQGTKFVTADIGGRDGSNWLIEALENGKYRCVERWGPRPGVVRNLGTLLLNLAGKENYK